MKKIITKSILTLAILLPHMAVAVVTEEMATLMRQIFNSEEHKVKWESLEKFADALPEMGDEWRNTDVTYKINVMKAVSQYESENNKLKHEKDFQKLTDEEIFLSRVKYPGDVLVKASRDTDTRAGEFKTTVGKKPLLAWVAKQGSDAGRVVRLLHAADRLENCGNLTSNVREWFDANSTKAIPFFEKTNFLNFKNKVFALKDYMPLFDWVESCGVDGYNLLENLAIFPFLDNEEWLWQKVKEKGVAKRGLCQLAAKFVRIGNSAQLISSMLDYLDNLSSDEQKKLQQIDQLHIKNGMGRIVHDESYNQLFFAEIFTFALGISAAHNKLMLKFQNCNFVYSDQGNFSNCFAEWQFRHYKNIVKGLDDPDAELATLLLYQRHDLIDLLKEIVAFLRDSTPAQKVVVRALVPLLSDQIDRIKTLRTIVATPDAPWLASDVIMSAQRIVERTKEQPKDLADFLQKIEAFGENRSELVALFLAYVGPRWSLDDCLRFIESIKDLGEQRAKILGKAKELYNSADRNVKWEETCSFGWLIWSIQDAQNYFVRMALEATIPMAQERLAQIEAAMKSKVHERSKLHLMRNHETLLQEPVIAAAADVVAYLGHGSDSPIKLLTLIDICKAEWPGIFELAKQNQSKESSFDDFVALLVLIADIETNRAELLEKAKEFFTADYPQQNWEQIDLVYKEHALVQARDFFERIALEASLPMAQENLEQAEAAMKCKLSDAGKLTLLQNEPSLLQPPLIASAKDVVDYCEAKVDDPISLLKIMANCRNEWAAIFELAKQHQLPGNLNMFLVLLAKIQFIPAQRETVLDKARELFEAAHKIEVSTYSDFWKVCGNEKTSYIDRAIEVLAPKRGIDDDN